VVNAYWARLPESARVTACHKGLETVRAAGTNNGKCEVDKDQGLCLDRHLSAPGKRVNRLDLLYKYQPAAQFPGSAQAEIDKDRVSEEV